MLKKLFILFSFVFIVFALSGCAKQGLPYHRYSYYAKHLKLAEKVRNFCKKNYPGWKDTYLREKERLINRKPSKRLTNCANAWSAVANHNFKFTLPKN